MDGHEYIFHIRSSQSDSSERISSKASTANVAQQQKKVPNLLQRLNFAAGVTLLLLESQKFGAETFVQGFLEDRCGAWGRGGALRREEV
jgi:hypothetical protein